MTAARRRDLRLMLVSAAVSGACLGVALSIVTLGFESNDDVGMAQIVSGVTTGAPSAELIFSNLLIGWVLKFLYGLTDRRIAHKPLADHVRHLVIHGVLHLLGFDHEDTQEAEVMEGLETTILAGLGVPDPYREAVHG